MKGDSLLDQPCGIEIRSLEQSRLTAPFLRPAGRLKLHITFVMDNRRILMGLVYPVRFGGFCVVQQGSAGAITAVDKR